METIGSAKLISTLDMKTTHDSIGNTKLVIKYGYRKMVSSANQKAGMNVIHGLSHQFIQMAQLGFNADQSQND